MFTSFLVRFFRGCRLPASSPPGSVCPTPPAGLPLFCGGSFFLYRHSPELHRASRPRAARGSCFLPPSFNALRLFLFCFQCSLSIILYMILTNMSSFILIFFYFFKKFFSGLAGDLKISKRFLKIFFYFS